MTITAHDTRALRHADAICFDHHADGTGAIRAIRRAEHSASGYEETHEIPVSSSVENYGRGADAYLGFAMIMSAQYDDTARTLVRRVIRVGTDVHLRWTRDNASPVTRDAGVVRDELRLIVGAGTSRAETYLVQTFIGLDNTARMIRTASRV